jgi:orotate phosphoribosyltransferase
MFAVFGLVAMQYRSLDDLNQVLRERALDFCQGVDAIVGIPRSGLLAASILALHTNLPLADLNGFCEGRLLSAGRRGKQFHANAVHRVLVLDDSLYAGYEMERARRIIAASRVKCEVVFGVVYCAPGKESLVDKFGEVCDVPRIFEWNLMHHPVLAEACVDIDGVLCRDPFNTENDDGPRYREFLRTVDPRCRPSVKINTLVTCRLEKYRDLTENWLCLAGIEYDRLVMLDLPDLHARRRWSRHGEYKAEVFAASSAKLFIESDYSQAKIIADSSLKPVFCVDTGAIVYPGITEVVVASAYRVPVALKKRLLMLRLWLLMRLHPNSFGSPR